MYFRFGIDPLTNLSDSAFSFIIAKNPHSDPFKRTLGGGDGDRFVTGRFLSGSETDYEVVVHNDSAFITQGLKDLNLAHYVSAKAYSVSPFNLKGMRVALKSAMSGKNPAGPEITDEQVAAERPLFCLIGPFAVPFAQVAEVFTAAGFAVRDVTTGFMDIACVVHLSMTAPVALFLQKVYTLSTFLTVKQEDKKYLEDELIRQLMGTSKSWLASMGPVWVDRVTHRLSGGHKGLKAEFNDALEPAEPSDDASADGIAPEIVKRSMGFHDRRHELIISAIPEDARSIVELGCGNGKLLIKLAEARPDAALFGFEAEKWDIRKAARRLKGKATLVEDNFLAAYFETGLLEPDALVLSEVIEHLDKPDRNLLIRQLYLMWQPKVILITCPNIAYNEVLGLPPGELRHHDHKIEHTWEQFMAEVIMPLSADYRCDMLLMMPDLPVQGQPSFVMVARRMPDDMRKHRTPDLGMVYQAREKQAPVALEEVGYVVNADEIRAGLTHPAYRSHRRLIPFLSPTMAPVDFDPLHPEYLEYPEKAFEYYARRGVGTLAEQKKRMGSRCHLVVFRDAEMAASMGFPSPVYGISRGGYPFFTKEGDVERLHAALAPCLGVDMIILDCEVMPWAYKAGDDHHGLISKQFRAPGEAALIYKNLTGQDGTNAALFLRALDRYAAPGDLEVHVFGVIAQADLDGRGGFRNKYLGEMQTVYEQTEVLADMFDGLAPLVTVAKTRYCEVDNIVSRAGSVDRWLSYTHDEGGEGFVYKPMAAGLMPDGYPIQPALKVRGSDYLRIIYGFDYLEPSIFPRLQKRGTSAKRKLAIQEAVLGRRILLSFMNNMHDTHDRNVAAFLGMDGLTSAKIDQTL